MVFHLDSVLGWWLLTLAVGVLVWLIAALMRGTFFLWSRAKSPFMFWFGLGALLLWEASLVSGTVANFSGFVGQ